MSATGGIVADDVEKEISVEDDDPPLGNIALDNTATLAIDEEKSGEFNVKLSVEPDANVTVALASDNDDVTMVPASLTFTTTNYDQHQEVVVSAAHDHDADDDTATITLSATGGIRADDVTKSISVEDDDPPLGNIVLDNTATLAIDESGTGEFNVDLSVAPDANVTVTLTSNNADVTMVPASLTFTTANWNQPQEVVVSAAHDDGAGDDTATITLKATGGIRASDVTKEVSVDDDDMVDILLSARALKTIIEGGVGDYFEVKLATRPTANIKMSITPENSSIVIDTELEKPGNQNTQLEFLRDGANSWRDYQRVMVYAALDDANPTDGPFNIEISVDPDPNKPSDYDNETESVSVNVRKRPVGNFVFEPAPTIALVKGDSRSLAVSLDTEPSDSVIVRLTHTLDPSYLGISPTSLTFTTSNYKVPQMVTIIPRQDRVDADRKGAITVEAISGIRAKSTLDVTIENAAPRSRIVLSESGPLLIPEGQVKELTVKLDAKPIGPIEVALIADHPDISFSRPILTFTERNYNVEQLVVIASEQDVDLMDEDIAITLTATGGIRASDEMIEVSVIDDDRTTPDWPVKAQALALAPSDAQDDAILRLHCKEEEIDCAVHLKCAAQVDGTIFEGSIPQVPARGALTLSVSDIEGYLGRSWSKKGRLGCFLHSEQNIDTQVWTRSGDGVLVNNSAFIRSVREGEMYRADIESIPSPDETEESNIRIRCTSAIIAPRCAVSLSCYDDAGRRYDGDLGTIERLRVRHLQSDELSRLIGHRWSGVGLSCEIRSDQIFTVQVMTRTGGGGALVNNSA
ncbi:MAG: hypothetical protein ISN28_13225, partial [Ectothiorhodospiraceae bacterium AqS1]|nr:hypothetical protein [Ectothiorhodospiraceae bacterium AqS1]